MSLISEHKYNALVSTFQVETVPHTFKFVCSDRSAQMKFQDHPDFTQTKMLVCAVLSIYLHTF
jgi:hypothetical protein